MTDLTKTLIALGEVGHLPASTGIEAKLCRPEFLVEIEVVALFLHSTEKTDREKER